MARTVGKVSDKFNVRSNTLYEEYNPELQKRVVDKVISALSN